MPSKSPKRPTAAPSPVPEPVATPPTPPTVETVETACGVLPYKTLAEWRAVRKLSQAGLARLVGLNQVTIYNIEAGRNLASLDSALRIARALGVMAEQVAWNTTPQKRPPPSP